MPFMPMRQDHSTPKFDGNPLSLRRFFEDVELLADRCGLDDKSKIEWAIRYVESNEEYELWECQSRQCAHNWERFKQVILELYPEVDHQKRYKARYLDLLVNDQALKPMNNLYQLGDYYRNFLRISFFAKDIDKMSDGQLGRLFLRGFGHDFRYRLHLCFAKSPFDDIEGVSVEKIFQTAKHMLPVISLRESEM